MIKQNLKLSIGLWVMAFLFCSKALLYADGQEGFGLEFGFGVDAAASANNVLLANPPLPMLYYDKHKYKFTIQPYIFDGKLDSIEPAKGESSAAKRSGNFKGWGAGCSFSYGLAKKWGIYTFVSAVRSIMPILSTQDDHWETKQIILK